MSDVITTHSFTGMLVSENDHVVLSQGLAPALTVVAAGKNHWSEAWMFEMEKINQKQKGYQIVWNLIIWLAQGELSAPV